LQELEHSRVDLRIINLETAITSAETHWLDKEIHYRMHPQNVGCLTAARINVCALANNHILDWSYDGLVETLQTLDAARVSHAGAGHNATEASAPAIMNVANKGRVLFFSFGSTMSGVFEKWRATDSRAGVNLLDDLSEKTAVRIADSMRHFQQPGDLLIASIHWGSNWGYEVPRAHVRFAHRLIDGGVDVVHGHSSHHPRPIEVYRDKLVLYGCGDCIDDYEGIAGFEELRHDLVLLYFPTVDPRNGELLQLRMTPMRLRWMRLNRASVEEADWLQRTVCRVSAPFGTAVDLASDGALVLR